MLNFDGHSSSRLGFFHDLQKHLLEEGNKSSNKNTNVLRLVVDLKRCASDRISICILPKLTTYILPRSMISFFCVTGSTFTTHRGVPTRNVPSRMSTPKIIGSRFVKAAMVLSLHGHTAWGAASFRFASTISAL